MEQSIKQRYSAAVLDELLERYAIAPANIRALDAFESFIYAFERDDAPFILRVGHSERRSVELIHGEVDWVNFLAAGGVPVAQAVPSQRGALVETIADGHGAHWLATAFVRAAGRPAWEVGWSPALYTTYGRLIGALHARTQRYQPADERWRRPGWDAALLEYVERYLPASETAALSHYRELRAHMRTLPQDRASYGLIHQDAHPGNFFVDAAGQITLFDFDDCIYSWFINDIAIILFYMVMDAEDVPAFTLEFLRHFLAGYRQHNQLDPRWLAEIPTFLKLRELELYALMHRDFDVHTIDDWWCARYMRGRKAKIDRRAPYIDFDFTTLAAQL